MGNSYSSIDPDEFINDTSTNIIGKGNYGTVYANSKKNNLVVKESIHIDVCENWKRESYIQKNTFDIYHETFKNQEILDYIDIPELFEFKEIRNKCYLVMERIIPPSGDPDSFNNLLGKTLHLYLCHDDYRDQISINVGIAIGQKQASRYIDVKKIIFYMGVILAFFHFGLGYDGNDVEYILGKTSKNDKIKVYVIDYGWVRKIESSDDFIGFSCYFPLEDKNFRKGYIEGARIYGKYEEAEIVLSKI